MLFVVLLLLPQAKLQFSRIGGSRRVERVSTVRDTAIGMAALVVVMGIAGEVLSQTNVNRITLGMATALIALSLVTGWTHRHVQGIPAGHGIRVLLVTGSYFAVLAVLSTDRLLESSAYHYATVF